MKKALFIMMCCIAVFFCACNKEKPNEKFIGTYSGKAAGNVNITMAQLGVSEDVAEDFDITMVITAGEEGDQVVATCSFEDEVYSINGTVDGNNVDFDPASFSYTESDSEIPFNVNATIDLNGSLVSDGLMINGTIVGDGTVTVPVAIGSISSPINIIGTMGGTLTKLLAE